MDKNFTNKNTKAQPQPRPGQMPSPPEFLTRPAPASEGTSYPVAVEEHVAAEMPKSIDFGLYQNAINDRKQAEMSAAEIYAQYLELVTFNQRLLRGQKTIQLFKRRVRKVYDSALNRQGRHSDEALRARRHQLGVEKALNDTQQENEGLRASNRAHEEAYQQILKRLGQAEAQMEQANHQFRTLAEEFDNRGILLEEADRHIQGYQAQIELQNQSLGEWHDKYSKIRDENLILQSQMRDIQMREAGVATLNNELANSATKAQKQIYELEDKLERLTRESQTKMATLEVEVDRHREQRRVEALLEKSKKLQAGEKVTFVTDNKQKANVEQWNGFYEKWADIINGLTTHSNPIENTKKDTVAVGATINQVQSSELLSEAGDLEIL
jgi:chromosome segregation ATPase